MDKVTISLIVSSVVVFLLIIGSVVMIVVGETGKNSERNIYMRNGGKAVPTNDSLGKQEFTQLSNYDISRNVPVSEFVINGNVLPRHDGNDKESYEGNAAPAGSYRALEQKYAADDIVGTKANGVDPFKRTSLRSTATTGVGSYETLTRPSSANVGKRYPFKDAGVPVLLTNRIFSIFATYVPSYNAQTPSVMSLQPLGGLPTLDWKLHTEELEIIHLANKDDTILHPSCFFPHIVVKEETSTLEIQFPFITDAKLLNQLMTHVSMPDYSIYLSIFAIDRDYNYYDFPFTYSTTTTDMAPHSKQQTENAHKMEKAVARASQIRANRDLPDHLKKGKQLKNEKLEHFARRLSHMHNLTEYNTMKGGVAKFHIPSDHVVEFIILKTPKPDASFPSTLLALQGPHAHDSSEEGASGLEHGVSHSLFNSHFANGRDRNASGRHVNGQYLDGEKHSSQNTSQFSLQTPLSLRDVLLQNRYRKSEI